MKLNEFIRKYRLSIDAVIYDRIPLFGRINDEERREWVLNEEGLYMWAKSEGVRI
jgi:hypothetical protein